MRVWQQFLGRTRAGVRTRRSERRFRLTFVALSLVFGVLACNLPPAETPIPPTPYLPATESAATSAPDTTDPPAAGWLPPGTIALYSVGPWESSQLFALVSDGSMVPLGVTMGRGQAASRQGRWVAYGSGTPPDMSIAIQRLDGGSAYAVPVTPGFDLFAMAFDSSETRLAFLEVGIPDGDATEWAIVVVNLGDGSTTRFVATMGADRAYLPGNPVGWSAGDELILDTFLPYSEGGFAGAFGVPLPPGTASAPLDTLGRRELIGAREYLSQLRLSPDGSDLLYLGRNLDYTPTDYEVMMMDLAVNQLWSLDLATGVPTLLLEITDGGALDDADWSPDGAETIFVYGNYAGPDFIPSVLRVRDGAGSVRDVAAVSLTPGDGFTGISWCAPNVAVYTIWTSGAMQLHMVDLSTGTTSLITTAEGVSVLGCIQ